jgi:peptidoglycan/xylan/chitin deacetylase (PgdA/CDA1 family)
MAWLPEGYRCAVALGFDCYIAGDHADANEGGATHGRLDDRVVRYMDELARVAEDSGARLQFFVPGMAFEGAGDHLLDLAQRGHAVDQMTYSQLPLVGSDPVGLRDQLLRTKTLLDERLPGEHVGLRAPAMTRNGIQAEADVQQVILDCGLRFVSSDYSTKSPETGPVAWADKNAAMLIKHMQPRWYPTGLLEIPSPGFSDRHYLDGLGRGLDEWIAHVRQCIDFAYDLGGLLYSPDLHPDTHFRHDPDLRAIRAIFEHAASKRERVLLCTVRQAHEWCAAAR